MPVSRRIRSNAPAFETLPIMRLWLLRLLVPLGAHRNTVLEDGFCSDNLAETLGLGDWVHSNAREFDAKTVRAELRTLHESAERLSCSVKVPECVGRNVALQRANFWAQHRQVALNTRQRKVINKLLEAGACGFEGGLTSRKYTAMTGAAAATATRDLTELSDANLLIKHGAGRSIYYDLALKGWGWKPAVKIK